MTSFECIKVVRKINKNSIESKVYKVSSFDGIHFIRVLSITLHLH